MSWCVYCREGVIWVHLQRKFFLMIFWEENLKSFKFNHPNKRILKHPPQKISAYTPAIVNSEPNFKSNNSIIRKFFINFLKQYLKRNKFLLLIFWLSLHFRPLHTPNSRPTAFKHIEQEKSEAEREKKAEENILIILINAAIVSVIALFAYFLPLPFLTFHKDVYAQ